MFASFADTSMIRKRATRRTELHREQLLRTFLMIGPVLHAEWERNILRRRDEKLVGGSYYHCLGYRCIFPVPRHTFSY